MWDFRKPVVALLAPSLLVIFSLAVAGGHMPLARPFEKILPNTPFVLSLLAMALGVWFRRERVVFTALLLGLTNLAMLLFWPQAPGNGPMWGIAYAVLCLALPPYLLSVAFFQDQGIFSRSGLTRLLWIILPIVLVIVAVDDAVAPEAQQWLTEVLHARIFSTDVDFWSHLPQPAILLFGGVMIFQVGRFVLSPVPMEGAMLGVTAATWAALHHVGNGAMPPLLLSSALLLLIVAVGQDAYHMAFLDELTGLPGRRALFSDFRRLGKRFTVAMVDVDHFKKFNDTYGHDVGDQVLQMVAEKMSQVTGGGRAFRYGGEEFTIVFTGKDVQSTSPHLDALREAIAQSTFSLRALDRPETVPKDKSRIRSAKSAKDAKTVNVTVSIGIAECSEKIADPDSVMKAADKALYKAKKAGRNRLAI